MILVDASVWIDHVRAPDATLSRLLDNGDVLAHPFVIGEIALGHVRRRDLILAELKNLPCADVAEDDEVLRFIDRFKLAGRGVGYIDAHLLASCFLTSGCTLWTQDRNLRSVAEKLGVVAKI